jgi:hypothetical protein
MSDIGRLSRIEIRNREMMQRMGFIRGGGPLASYCRAIATARACSAVTM